MISRRNFFTNAARLASLSAVASLGRNHLLAADSTPAPAPAPGIKPVTTPNGTSLPWKLKDGVKIFHLVAEPVSHEFAPGLKAECWGYNGQVHGPTIEAVEGETVRIYVTNKLPEGTTVHWHGLLVPNGMDGIGGLSQPPIAPGETFKYEFTLRQHGTYMYHSHHDEMTQMALGLMGMFIIHPKNASEPPPDRDYALMLSEWKIAPGTSRPDPSEMTDFNIFTINGRCFPGTEPLLAQKGERVRLRFGNLSAMDHHPIHMHGNVFNVVEEDGGVVPTASRFPQTTVLMPVGTTRVVEFVAENPGDWAMHCHMSHHVMNQMAHGLPNLIGINTDQLDDKLRDLVPGAMTMGGSGMGDMMSMGAPANSIPMSGGDGPFGGITMGGMFTIIKVRETLTGTADPGWYENPPHTLAAKATPEELQADGIR
ncbi:MAG: copper oxidase [Chthoniobacteraceae bacterium]